MATALLLLTDGDEREKAALNGVQRAYFVYPIRPGIIQATAYISFIVTT